MSLFLILLLELIFPLNNGQQVCVYDGGLDLSPLAESNIQCVMDNDATSEMLFQPCQSTIMCNFFDLDQYMITQVTLSGNCRAGIAMFEPEMQPSQTTVDGNSAWLFQYANGETTFCQGPRTLDLTFVCDESADPYDQSSISCGEYTEPECSYYLTVYTKYACSSGSDDNDSNGLSTGTISLIILLVIIILYCIGGYIFNGMRNPNEEGKWTDFSYNIPNSSFWSILPSLVFAGCKETSTFLKSKMNKGEAGKGRTDTYSELKDDVTSQTEYQ